MIAPLPFFPPTFLSTLSRLRSASNRPQAGSRGKNASLLIIQYARDAPGKGERERERGGYIYLYLPGVSKVFPLEEGKKTSTFLPPPLSLSSKNLRGRTSVASLKRRSNLYRVGIFCWHFSPPKAEQNHARLPPRTYPLGWRVTLEREREREGGRMLILHRLGPRWEPAANWKLSLITGEHVGRSTPISRGGYCSLSVPIRFPTSAYLGETYS